MTDVLSHDLHMLSCLDLSLPTWNTWVNICIQYFSLEYLHPLNIRCSILYFISFPIYLSGSNANFFVYFGKNWFFLLKQSPWFLLSRGIITYHHKHGKIKVMYYREKKKKQKKILKIIELRILIVIGVEVQAW